MGFCTEWESWDNRAVSSSQLDDRSRRALQRTEVQVCHGLAFLG